MVDTDDDASTGNAPPVPQDTLPRRGGKHRFGPFLGGGTLDNDYTISSSAQKFKFTTQLRDRKSVSNIERTLMAARYDASEKKFDGRLEFKPTEATIGEYDKETFIKVLKDKVNYHGQQSFYHLATPNGDVLYLLEKSNAHAFTVKEAIAQHIVRMNEPDLGDEDVDALDCFKCYDEYELEDIALSRLLVESLLTPDLRTQLHRQTCCGLVP